MALNKSITTALQFQNNATAPTAISFSEQPIVSDGKLVVNYRTTNPGVFTAGTAAEGNGANMNQDSNS